MYYPAYMNLAYRNELDSPESLVAPSEAVCEAVLYGEPSTAQFASEHNA